MALAMKVGLRPQDLAALFETVSVKVGTVLLVLGAMHFFNLYLFARIRRRTQLKHVPPPVPPMGRMMPMQG